jgi:hypothetical protein
MMDQENKDGECGCGGLCKWGTATKEEKIALLEKKEAKLEKMLAHIKKVKEAVASGTEMKHENHEGEKV